MKALTLETFNQAFLEEKQTGPGAVCKRRLPYLPRTAPLLEEIEQGYNNQSFHFYFVDALAENTLYKSMKLQGTPTVLFYYNGKQCHKFTGLREYEEIEFLIDRVMAGKM